MKSIRLLNKNDADIYSELVRKSFGSAKGFMVNRNSLTWTPTDDYYPTLGVFNNNKLVSMMRLEWILTEKELVYKSQEEVSFAPFTYPIGYLAKAATEPGYDGSGLNTLLRYHCFKIFKCWKVNWIVGFMVFGSPRVFTMQEMGYSFYTKKNKWNGAFVSDRNVHFAYLNVDEKMNDAMAYLEKELAPILNEYEVEFKHEEVPMKSKLNILFPWQV